MDNFIETLLLDILPADGASIGNQRLMEIALERAAGQPITADDLQRVRESLVARGVLGKGRGRGGSVYRLAGQQASDFSRAQPAAPPVEARPPAAPKPYPPQTAARAPVVGAPQVLSYRHADRRKNNPEVGMVTPATDPEEGKTRWCYDPHLDPALQFDFGRAQVEKLIDDALTSGDQATMRAALEELRRYSAPYLHWTGKAERTSFAVDTVSLHVHERIDPASILAAVRKQMKDGKSQGAAKAIQPDLFAAPFENLPLRDAIDFYRHEKGWSNRLIAGDSLLVMNSLLQKEGMAGRVQMIYIDPPYGIKYGSNFQPFVNKRDVKDRKDEDLTQEPEMIKAFRDTWELGIHSYLTYLRDRLLLARELLSESGSVFVQISDENLHHVKELMDEVFSSGNFVSVVAFQTTSGFAETNGLSRMGDYLIWYGKNREKIMIHSIYEQQEIEPGSIAAGWLITPNGLYRGVSAKEADNRTPLPKEARLYKPDNLLSQGASSEPQLFTFEGKTYEPSTNNHWKPNYPTGMQRLANTRRIHVAKNSIQYRRYADDFPLKARGNLWIDTLTGSFTDAKQYVVQTNTKVIERCLLMTTDPGDLVLDITCGSGTTAYVAEKWGQRWITCDTSRVAITLAKQRLMTASYDYYALRYPHEGLKGGFIYKTVPHVTLKSIANNPEIDEIYERMHPAIDAALQNLNQAAKRSLREWEIPFDFPADWSAPARAPFDAFHAARQVMQKKMDASIAAHADQETLYDQPLPDKGKLRISGPFSVEAVPCPTVLSLEETRPPEEADISIARSGESSRQHQWRDELLKTGIRGKGKQMLRFAELETQPSSNNFRYLHCAGHLDSGERVVVSFGPEHGALEQRQVAQALAEAGELFPLPKMIVFCAFAFDPEAAKDIDGLKGITALKAQMNTDLLTEDLKKARSNNQSFWLMGQPDVEVRKQKNGQYVVEVHGFDYFDTVKGELISGGKGKVAMWLLDTDYDERSLFPRQVFFPMAGGKDGWMRLKQTIRAELNEELLERFHGTVFLPFEAGANRKVAVKIVDDRGIESLKIIPLGY
ncbi:adenine-specific DNA-methyltransferase [Gammaproteobacteria bacterium]